MNKLLCFFWCYLSIALYYLFFFLLRHYSNFLDWQVFLFLFFFFNNQGLLLIFICFYDNLIIRNYPLSNIKVLFEVFVPLKRDYQLFLFRSIRFYTIVIRYNLIPSFDLHLLKDCQFITNKSVRADQSNWYCTNCCMEFDQFLFELEKLHGKWMIEIWRSFFWDLYYIWLFS